MNVKNEYKTINCNGFKKYAALFLLFTVFISTAFT